MPTSEGAQFVSCQGPLRNSFLNIQQMPLNACSVPHSLEPGEGDLCYSKVTRAGLAMTVSGPCGQAQDSRKFIMEKWRDPVGEESPRSFLEEKHVAGDVRVNRDKARKRKSWWRGPRLGGSERV